MTTGERIRALRQAAKLSQEELGARIGVQKAAIHKYETGLVVNLKKSTLEKLAQALHTTPAYLLGLEDPGLAPSAHPYHPTRSIPILGRISAGLPLYAEQNIEGYTFTDLNGGAEYFALRVSGDSMNAMGINDGYLIIVRRQDEVENGEVAVVVVGEEGATVKRFFKRQDHFVLHPENEALSDIIVDSVVILGKVIGLVRSF